MGIYIRIDPIILRGLQPVNRSLLTVVSVRIRIDPIILRGLQQFKKFWYE